MAGVKDLETFVCSDQLNRPNLAGVIDRGTPEAPVASKPWFRAHLPQALDIIQKPYYTARDGRRELLFDGSKWRGMEVVANVNYTSADTEGIAYPAGYRKMRYVYPVGTDGTISKFPIKSVTETEFNTQNDWGWRGFADWGWIEWMNNAHNGIITWMDRNGKFYLTWTPSTTRTLRMAYTGVIQPPATNEYTNNVSNWFTENLFLELATLVQAMMWKSMGEDDNAQRTMAAAQELLHNAWMLNQDQKSGSNANVFVPEPVYRMKGS